MIGAPLDNTSGSTAGRFLVYDMNRYQLLSPGGGDTWNVGAAESVHWRGGAPADLLLSVDGGNSYGLLESNVGGAADNTVSLVVPHQPTRFARIKVAPHDATVTGNARSDSLFTIQASIALLMLKAEPADGGGVLLSWNTDPGPADLAGYTVERAPGRSATWTLLAAGLRDTEYRDPDGGPGMSYRLTAVNGLGESLVLGETALTARAALSAWPLPYRGGKLSVAFATASGLGGGSAPAEVSVYDVSGRRVRQLASGAYDAGLHTASWDGRDAAGRAVPSGIYFLRAAGAGGDTRIKLVVVR